MKSVAGAAGADAVLTLTGDLGGRQQVLDEVHFSYSATPTGGRLRITSTGQTAYDVDLVGAGRGVVTFPGGYRGLPGVALVVTLTGAGAGVVGKVNVPNDWLE